MLSNKEIRALPKPSASKETVTLALSTSEHGENLVITGRKIKNTIVIDAFGKIGETDSVSLLYRYFVKQFDTKLYDCRNNKITNGYFTNITGYTYKYIATKRETEKLKKWLCPGTSNSSITSILNTYDSRRSSHNKKVRIQTKKNTIDAIMKKVRKIPSSFDKTVKETMSFSQYIFFDRKSREGICSCCGKTLQFSELPKFRDKEYGICPKCGEKIQFRSEKNRHRYKFRDTGMAVLIQKYDFHMLIARYFQITYDYSNDTKAAITKIEVMRTIIDYDNHTVKDYEWFYLNGDNENCKRWCPPQKSMFCSDGLHYRFLEGKLHKNGLLKELKLAKVDRFLKGHEIIADKLLEYCNQYHEDNCYRHIRYFEKLAETPEFEQLTKCGMYNLVVDCMRDYNSKILNSESSLLKILKLPNKDVLRDAIKMDIRKSELHTVQKYYQATDRVRPISEILNIANFFDGRKEKVFPLTDKRIRMARKYIENLNQSNPKKYGSYVSDYFDYIDACEELEYNMTSELVLYPKDFKKAHDEALANLKDQKLEKEYEQIKQLLPSIHDKYDFSNDKYLITAPNCGQEITYEGQALNHCVSRYVPDVAKGLTIILFLRKKENPEKPFVTMEVKNGKVMQVRGFDNNAPDQEVLDFVETFKQRKLIA